MNRNTPSFIFIYYKIFSKKCINNKKKHSVLFFFYFPLYFPCLSYFQVLFHCLLYMPDLFSLSFFYLSSSNFGISTLIFLVFYIFQHYFFVLYTCHYMLALFSQFFKLAAIFLSVFYICNHYFNCIFYLLPFLPSVYICHRFLVLN